MKNDTETPNATASTQDLNSDQQLSENDLESAAGGTTIPIPCTPFPEEDPILVVSSSSDLLRTKI